MKQILMEKKSWFKDLPCNTEAIIQDYELITGAAEKVLTYKEIIAIWRSKPELKE